MPLTDPLKATVFALRFAMLTGIPEVDEMLIVNVAGPAPFRPLMRTAAPLEVDVIEPEL